MQKNLVARVAWREPIRAQMLLLTATSLLVRHSYPTCHTCI